MSLEVSFPPPAKALTLNQRMHWAQKAKLTAAWREAAFYAAKQARLECRVPYLVTVVIPVKDRRKRDPHNWFPTVKPIVDGLVDAGVWPDDNSDWVTTTEPRLEPGGELVRVVMVAR